MGSVVSPLLLLFSHIFYKHPNKTVGMSSAKLVTDHKITPTIIIIFIMIYLVSLSFCAVVDVVPLQFLFCNTLTRLWLWLGDPP